MSVPQLDDSNREILTDKKINCDISNAKFENKLFIRLIIKNKKFENVSFKYTHFESSYLRKCTFDSCDFTGCKFIGTNFSGTIFIGCKFDYTIFEKTIIDDDILDNCCPAQENLKLKFARTLRTNFQQLGDSKSVNKAIRIELDATKEHLYKSWHSDDKSWHSDELYYRKECQYFSFKWFKFFFEWLNFLFWELIWGNGEDVCKLIITVLLFFCGMGIVDIFINQNQYLASNSLDFIWQIPVRIPAIFFATLSPSNYPLWYTTLIFFIRLVFFSLFTSVIVKRLNRR